MGRVLTGLILLIGVVFLVRGFLRDVEEHRTPPTQYIIRDDSRVDDSQTQITVTNMNDFDWENPVFVIKGRYRYKHSGTLHPQDKIHIPFKKFKTEEGTPFSKDQMANFELDIRVGNMARARK